MKLWSDYEGRTIAEVYRLDKLVRPEGRSAFFLTTNGTGTASLVRVIEAHFDEPEILARWQKVASIPQENLVTMRRFGQTMLDDTPLVFAVLEPTEISLEELLESRTLTTDEARQLAKSLIAAVDALHEAGFVHGHIETANILAAGETVKLRSDCVKEAVEPLDGESGQGIAEQKAVDTHAVATVVLEALTGRRSLQGSATLLPSPFDGVIRNGLSGKWGLAEMAAALGPVAPAQVAAATMPTPVASTLSPAPAAQPKPAPVAPAAPRVEPVVNVPAVAAKADAPQAPQGNLFTQPAAAPAQRPSVPFTPPDVRHRIVRPVEEVETWRGHVETWLDRLRRNPRATGAIAATVLVLSLIGWRMMRSEPAASAKGTASTPPAVTAPAAAPKPSPAVNKYAKGRGPSVAQPWPAEQSAVPAPATSTSAPAAPASRPAPTRSTAAVTPPRVPATSPVTTPTKTPSASGAVAPAGARTVWRVVAYTYNREDQAKQKADSLRQQHPSLNPEVFSPSGHAPYLVTLGGAMSREQAFAFKHTALSAGLPQDVYAQNYSH